MFSWAEPTWEMLKALCFDLTIFDVLENPTVIRRKTCIIHFQLVNTLYELQLEAKFTW